MSYQTGVAYGHKDLLKKIHAMIQGLPLIGTVVYAGTGTGELTMLAPVVTAVAETWTIACTVASLDSGTFSVVGSITGATADATVGVPYDNGKVSFTITDGVIDFSVADVFTVPLTLNPLVADGETWVIDRWDDTSSDWELIMHGPGLSATESLYCGLKTYDDAPLDYSNLKMNIFTGFVSSNDFNTQPGRNPDNHACPLWQLGIEYHLIINGNRIVCLAKVETVFMSFYLGRFLPYGTPNQYPYPIGMWSMLLTDSATRYSSSSCRMGIKKNNATVIRFVDGSYRFVRVFPFYSMVNNDSLSTAQDNLYDNNLRETPTNIYPITPVMLYDTSPNIYGEFDNCYHVSGFANAVENTVTIGGDTYIIWRDHELTGFYDYFAVRIS